MRGHRGFMPRNRGSSGLGEIDEQDSTPPCSNGFPVCGSGGTVDIVFGMVHQPGVSSSGQAIPLFCYCITLIVVLTVCVY